MFVVVHFGMVINTIAVEEGLKDLRSSFSVVGFGNPVVFLADGLGVGLVLERRGCEDGEVEVEEDLGVEIGWVWAVSFGEMD